MPKSFAWCAISLEHNFIVWEGSDSIAEHYPGVPCDLANGFYVSGLAGHHGLRHVAAGQDMAAHHMGMDERLELKAVVTKDLGQSGS